MAETDHPLERRAEWLDIHRKRIEELERQLADKSGQWNREANCFLYKEHGGENGIACEALCEAERQLATARQFQDAVIDELVVCHIYSKEHDSDARKALHDAITWNVRVALDPLVSSDAQALIGKARRQERERCAKVCEDWGTAKVIKWQESELADDAKASAWDALQCAAAIRALPDEEGK